MQKRRQLVLKQANHRLPESLTLEFISDLSEVLSQDPRPEAEYLRRYWLTKYCELDAVKAKERRDAAIKKWLSVEVRNYGITQRFNAGFADPCYDVATVKLDHILDRARAVVYEVLGDTPSLDVAYAAYSGGASTSKPRSQGHPALKFLGKADSTRRAWQLGQQLLERSQYARHIYDSGLEPRIVGESVLFTVPKNSDIDRVACKEPDINVFLQKMFGSQIRYLLKRKGIDLNDQSINADLARVGSVDQSLATLDLSSASDSINTELVRRLLPPDWFWYLDAVRCHSINIDGESHQLNMFSSMGNGFTFELESLLFYALARATAWVTGLRGRISVYGDDIIVPTNLAQYVVQVLRHVGFQTNDDKSFVDGPFRESCGAYWHCGRNVKPFFLKGPLVRLTDLIKVLNSFLYWASGFMEDGKYSVVDPSYEAVFNKYRDLVPAPLWGGQDFTSITSLVTGDRPRKELVEVVRMRAYSNIGGYLAWLQATALRDSHRSVTILGTSNTGIYRVRRNTSWTTDMPLLLIRSGEWYDEREAKLL